MASDRWSRMMRTRWNERAAEDPFYYIETSHWNGDITSFFALGDERADLLIDPVLSELTTNPSEGVALDLGCGLGRFTRPLSRRFREVVGVDVAPEMVKKAIELNAAEDYGNIRFLLGNGVVLPLGSATVDFVWSYEVMQHMPSRKIISRNLQEIGRVLRPGGQALVHVRPAPGPEIRRRVKSALPPRMQSAIVRWREGPMMRNTHDPTFTGPVGLKPRDIRRLCRSAGLRLINIRPDPTNAPGARVFLQLER